MKKKLVLKKEVVALLEVDEMRRQRGGEPKKSEGNSCDCPADPGGEPTIGFMCYTVNDATWCNPGFSKEAIGNPGCPGTLGC